MRDVRVTHMLMSSSASVREILPEILRDILPGTVSLLLPQILTATLNQQVYQNIEEVSCSIAAGRYCILAT